MSETIQKLIDNKVASRIHAKDATLYSFSPEAQAVAEQFMGWTDLASKPPCSLKRVQDFADAEVRFGINTVVLVGQGGSTQAPMTITKYNKLDSNRVTFKTIDSDSPVRFREILCSANPFTTLFIISSKSGSTIEPRAILSAIRDHLATELSEEEIPRHLVAITDPGSELEQMARAEGWRQVFLGEPSVGGRFSALSVFGLLPAAFVGINLDAALLNALEAEQECSADNDMNPAIQLAAFLYDNYCAGRNKFSMLTPKRGRVLGLWIEQLVAESLGKNGQGILPNIEIDSLLLTQDPGDRAVIMYQTKNDLRDEQTNFEMSLRYVNPEIPCLEYGIDSVYELARHFLIWEYAIAMCGYLMEVCPFDQPDVASAKAAVLEILANGMPGPNYTEAFTEKVPMGTAEVRYSDCLAPTDNLRDTLKELFGSIEPGDYFALNAFLPFTGEYRREALEDIRHRIAERFGVVSCLEVGPRYLHSTGQLQKGGPNTGVFLILSADEMEDIPLREEAASLGTLAKSQAAGDAITLAERGRRVVHVHLPDNTGATLRAFADIVRDAVEAL